MGQKFDKMKCQSMLRQAQARMNIHRSKKLGQIAKNKDTICKHLESGNEVNAKIWCETLINEENIIPVYDVVNTYCDQLNGRLNQIVKFGVPKDMNQTFATIIHSAAKLDCDELMQVRKMISPLFDKQFIKECDSNYDMLNPVVAQNIDIKIPEQGEVVLRLVNLAQERNIDYIPSAESLSVLNAYCLRKGIPSPIGGGDAPAYVPQPQALDLNAMNNMANQQQQQQQQQNMVMPPQNQPIQPPPSNNNNNNNGGNYYNPVPPSNNGNGGVSSFQPPAQQTYIPQQDMNNQGFPVVNPPQKQNDADIIEGQQIQENQTMDPQNQASNNNNDIDDFQARLDALKNL